MNTDNTTKVDLKLANIENIQHIIVVTNSEAKRIETSPYIGLKYKLLKSDTE